LGQRQGNFKLVRIIARQDPYRILREKYFLVYIRDCYAKPYYETPFVISLKDLPNYQCWIGKWPIFSLYGYLGHALVLPRGWLVTNILAVKTHPLGLNYGVYYVMIYLVGLRPRGF